MDHIWYKTYKTAGIPEQIVMPSDSTSMIDIFERNFQKFG